MITVRRLFERAEDAPTPLYSLLRTRDEAHGNLLMLQRAPFLRLKGPLSQLRGGPLASPPIDTIVQHAATRKGCKLEETWIVDGSLIG